MKREAIRVLQRSFVHFDLLNVRSDTSNALEGLGMKVFCTGLSRTGTTSLCAGLELLGLRAKHFPLAMFGNAERFGGPAFRPRLSRNPLRRWQLHRELKALRCTDPLVMLGSYDVFSDLPVPLYFTELDRRYPNAKFIHTTRPLADWLASMEWLLQRGRFERRWTVGEVADELHQSIYGCTGYDEPLLRNAWFRHENAVRSHFAGRSDKLLTLDIACGELSFDRIAPFLGLEIPESEFPAANAKSVA